MLETLITTAIILAAGVWLVCRLHGAAAGRGGCSCDGCGKKDCAARQSGSGGGGR